MQNAYQNLPNGTEVYYTGDMANASQELRIIGREGNIYLTKSLTREDNANEISSIPVSAIGPASRNCSPRFQVTVEREILFGRLPGAFGSEFYFEGRDWMVGANVEMGTRRSVTAFIPNTTELARFVIDGTELSKCS